MADTHDHTCTECGTRFACFVLEAQWDEGDCGGVDGDGRCPACANAAFDAIGKRRVGW